MFDTLSIRLKIVLLSGLCLLGVIALVVGINIYNTNQNDQLVSDSSSRMLTDGVEQLLQAKAAEQAVQLQKTFGDSLLALTALSDQIKDLRIQASKRGLEAGALREDINQSLKTTFDRNSKVLVSGCHSNPTPWMARTANSSTTRRARPMKKGVSPAIGAVPAAKA